jgi:hypothetical protein
MIPALPFLTLFLVVCAATIPVATPPAIAVAVNLSTFALMSACLYTAAVVVMKVHVADATIADKSGLGCSRNTR